MNSDKLDNPASHSLNETHQSFAIGNDEIKFYHPGICRGINSKQPDLIGFIKSDAGISKRILVVCIGIPVVFFARRNVRSNQ